MKREPRREGRGSKVTNEQSSDASRLLAPAPQKSKRKKRGAGKTNRQRRKNIARLVVDRHGRLTRAALAFPYLAAAAWHCPAGKHRHLDLIEFLHWVCAPAVIEQA